MTAIPSTRVRPGFRRMVAIVLAILIPYAAWSAWDYAEATRLARAIDAVHERSASARDVSRLPEPADDAARYYLAAGSLTTTVPEMPVIWNALRDRTAPVPPDLLARAHAILDEQAAVFALVDRAERAPAHPWRLESFGEHIALSKLSQLMAFRTIVLARQGESEAAARSLLQQIDLARALDDVQPGMAVPWGLHRSWVLGSAAMELGILLSAGPPPASMLARLSEAYRADVPEDVARTIAWQQETLIANARFSSLTVDRLMRPLVRQKLAGDLEARLSILERLPVESQDWPGRLAWAQREVAANRGVLRPYADILTTIKNAAAGVASQRTARVVVAAARFRDQHGEPPASIAALVPEWLDAVPADPFDGKPLRWQVTDGGFMAYSVGVNGVDDGGDLAQFTAAMGSPAYSPDIGVRVQTP